MGSLDSEKTTFRKLLDRLREKGIISTDKEFGTKCGFDAQMVKNFHQGKRKIDTLDLKAIKTAFPSININSLIWDTEDFLMGEGEIGAELNEPPLDYGSKELQKEFANMIKDLQPNPTKENLERLGLKVKQLVSDNQKLTKKLETINDEWYKKVRAFADDIKKF